MLRSCWDSGLGAVLGRSSIHCWDGHGAAKDGPMSRFIFKVTHKICLVDSMSGYTVEKFWHIGNYRYVFYRFVLEQFCLQQFKKPCLLLDAGCGPRISSLSHVPKYVFVISVDISRRNVVESHRKAKQKGYENFNFIVASITTLPFRHKTFDIVICADVLEHITTNQEAINDISRTCKRKAEFVGSTSNRLNPVMLFDSFTPKSVVKILTERFAGAQYERHSRFSFCRLMQALNHANFHVCDVSLLGFPPFQPWLYEFSNKQLPWYVCVWIIFNRLTEKKPLNFLKEAVVFHAIKKG